MTDFLTAHDPGDEDTPPLGLSRYCEMCDEWMRHKECRACGAPTVRTRDYDGPWDAPTDAESSSERDERLTRQEGR